MHEIQLEEILKSNLGKNYTSLPKSLKVKVYKFLYKLLKIRDINEFLSKYFHLRNFDFLNQYFEDSNFSYLIKSTEKHNIPAQGKVIIIANHPLAGIDSMALLAAVGEIRSDVKIVINDILMEFDNLHDLFIPTSLYNKSGSRLTHKMLTESIQNDEAVIIFPAGEVSRLGFKGIRDRKWSKSVVFLARKYDVPIVPVFVEGRNSWLFYFLSSIWSVLGTLLIPSEFMKFKNKTISFVIGNPILPKNLFQNDENDVLILQKLRREVYNLKHNRKRIFKTDKAIIKEIERNVIQEELSKSQLLGKTNDGKSIYLCKFSDSYNIIKEIGRLREITFRKIGAGSGNRIDINKFDRFYNHIVLWDEDNKEIIGSYRIAKTKEILDIHGKEALYTNSLFTYNPEFEHILGKTLESGRSFIQEHYWGSSALDYIWQGLGAFLSQNPQIKYLIGAVSISDEYPLEIREMIVYHYKKWYKAPENYAVARHPFTLSNEREKELRIFFDGNNHTEDFKKMKRTLIDKGISLPVLYRRYIELCEYGGASFVDFTVNVGFSDVIDGLLVLEIDKFNQEARERYLVPDQKFDVL